ncbi:Protein YigP clustered withubiquinone biosynthetic genes [Salmonella enterica subsp. salamae]|uniref:Protein YigP clustered withubiquinone biosynthetic genes n=1 Tax=Salmonella enterica subsp. salamae TaxID=59202 RepID=A0A6D2GEZ9_SALER|nr:Protein YigP clustered withubiquinone biosynthetic genes [Salmonella enterica subsp. salamae]
MPFKPLVTAGIEGLLNTFLYRSPALKSARTRLQGKVLRVELKGFSTPLVLVFSERQVDVLGAWEGEADCTVITQAGVLPKLRDRQQLAALIRSGELEVQGRYSGRAKFCGARRSRRIRTCGTVGAIHWRYCGGKYR